MASKAIFVTTRFVGFHRWPDAPDSTAFLRIRHRHVFHVRLDASVDGDDRELEFFAVKEWLERFLGWWPSDLGAMSCEQLAALVVSAAVEEYGGDRWYACEVSEDGENGATVDTRP